MRQRGSSASKKRIMAAIKRCFVQVYGDVWLLSKAPLIAPAPQSSNDLLLNRITFFLVVAISKLNNRSTIWWHVTKVELSYSSGSYKTQMFWFWVSYVCTQKNTTQKKDSEEGKINLCLYINVPSDKFIFWLLKQSS